MTGCIAVFGGTGFIGRHLVALLLQSGATVRVAVRDPGGIGIPTDPSTGTEIVQADILDETSVDRAMVGADAVFNLVGILTETATQTYHAIHVEAARRVALTAHRHGVRRLIHISALGARPTSPAISDRTKAEGEWAVRAVFPEATIVRPSPTFGEDDHFFTRFAAMIRSSPVLPLIGGGTRRFQPVFVGDVTAGLLELLKHPDTAGKTYEFGGPQVCTFKGLLELLLTALNRQRVLIPMPFVLAEMQAGLLEMLPNPPLTRDQVRLLKTDKVVSGMEPTLGDLGVQMQPLEEFLAGQAHLSGINNRQPISPQYPNTTCRLQAAHAGVCPTCLRCLACRPTPTGPADHADYGALVDAELTSDRQLIRA